MSPTQIKIILFDADGLLIKRNNYFSVRLSTEFNIPSEKVQRFFAQEWTDIVTGQADLKQRLKPYLKNWGWPGDLNSLLEYWFSSEADLEHKVLNSIQQLSNQGIICCLATNQEKYRFDYFKYDLQFDQIFTKLYASCHIGFKKPQKQYYQLIWQDLNRPPLNTILFWDDTYINISTARAFGIHAEVYKNYNQYQLKLKDKYDLIIE